MQQFEVGDIVIGKQSANDAYNTTREGWKGNVIATRPEIGTIAVRDLETKTIFVVRSEHFDLYKKKQPYKFVDAKELLNML